jgi:hypothetical protein
MEARYMTAELKVLEKDELSLPVPAQKLTDCMVERVGFELTGDFVADQ